MSELHFHVITPGMLAAVLAATSDGKELIDKFVPGCRVYCEDILVGRAVDGPHFEPVCDDPRHGVHPRYEQAASRIKAIINKLRVVPAPVEGPCHKCGGMEFLTGSPALQVAMMALMFKMFRGVALPAGLELLSVASDLQVPTAGDRLEAILPRPALADCPSATPAPSPATQSPDEVATEAPSPQPDNGGTHGTDQ